MINLVRRMANAVLPRDVIVVRVLTGPARGVRLPIKPQSEKFYWRGGQDPSVAAAIQTALRPGDTFWDVGAHIGYMTAIGARAVGQRGRVHAFEPIPENVKRLRQTVALNRLVNVEVHPVAVSDIEGRLEFHRGASSLQWRIGSGDETVDSVTLDAIAVTLPPPCVVKVDVEGAEASVLRGAARLVTTARPILILECLTEASRKECAALLPDYAAAALDGRNWLFIWRPNQP